MSDFSERLKNLAQKLNISDFKKRVAEIEDQSADPNFWQDSPKAQKLMQELSDIQGKVKRFEELGARVDLFDLLPPLDQSSERIIIEKELKSLETDTFLNGRYDKNNAIFAIHAGQGGTEACDWVSILDRMYTRYFESKNFKYDKLDEVRGEEAGFKSISYEVSGRFAYGYLKGEVGVHRLVRLSPFNADNKRQTSFALVEVLPVIEESGEMDIKPEEIIFEAIRAHGPGGQNVNKVSSAVRLTHKPTGIMVRVDSQRFQHKNRETALEILRGKLFALEEAKRKGEESVLKGEYKVPGWGNQIRSYVLQPYKMVKDLRSGIETSQTEKVLDGELEEFIEAELRMQR